MLKTRLAPVVAAFSVAGLLAWLALTRPVRPTVAPRPAEAAVVAPPPEIPVGGGSAVPCAVPLAWRLAGVDPRFAIDRETALAQTRSAAAAWERAAGRSLFVEDSLRGLPIRLVYDARQEGSIERKRLESSLAQVDDRLHAESLSLDNRRAAYEQRRQAYERQAAELARASAVHADSVRAFNLGASGATTSDLRTAQQRLDRQQGDLLAVQVDLEEQRIAIRNDAEALNRQIDDHRARVAELLDNMPPTRVESGIYRELVSRNADGSLAARRAVDVYEFDDRGELWLVLAHELGHALGLGHAPKPGAVMSEAHLRTQKIVSGIRPADVGLLRERCPELFEPR